MIAQAPFEQYLYSAVVLQYRLLLLERYIAHAIARCLISFRFYSFFNLWILNDDDDENDDYIMMLMTTTMTMMVEKKAAL